MYPCHCGFEAKTPGGLASHTRARHPASSLVTATSGPRVDLLRELLKRLTERAEDAKADELPALSRQIVQVSREIEQLAPKGVSKVDEIRQRREHRRAKTARQ